MSPHEITRYKDGEIVSEEYESDGFALVRASRFAMGLAASTIMVLSVGVWGPALGVGGGILGTGTDTAATPPSYLAPDIPTGVTGVMFLDTAGYATTAAFSGDSDDSISYTVFEFDSLRGTGWDLVTPDTQSYGVADVYRSDTLLAELTANDTFKVRALHHGMASGLSSNWGVADTFVAVGGVIFRMDLSAGAFPLAGFDFLSDTVTNNSSILRRADAGPTGGASYQISHPGDSSSGTQPYMGWGKILPEAAPFVYGDTVYVRFRFRFIADTRCESWNINEQVTYHATKFHIINDAATGGNAEGRVMIGIHCTANSAGPDATIDSVSYNVRRANGTQRCNSDGTQGVPAAGWTNTHINDTTWVDFQFEMIHSSSENAADGEYALWLDNDTYGSPECRVTTALQGAMVRALPVEDQHGDTLVIVNTNGAPSDLKWGFYWNTIPDLSSNGLMGYELTDYEVGTSFSTSWNN